MKMAITESTETVLVAGRLLFIRVLEVWSPSQLASLN
jgi:hypothetical protein